MQFRPESRRSGARSSYEVGISASRSGYAPGAEPSAVHGPLGSNDGPAAPVQATRSAAMAMPRTDARRRDIAGERTTPARMVRPDTWYLASRTGARMPTTFRPARSGRGSHCREPCTPRKVLARRPAIEPGASWGVGHGSRHGRCVEEVRHRRSRVSVTSRVTGSFGQQAWWTVGAAGLIQTSFAPRSPSGIGGRSRFSGQAS